MILHEQQTYQFIGPSPTSSDGGRSHFARFRQRRNHRYSWDLSFLRQTMEEKIKNDGLHALSRKLRSDYTKKLDDAKRHELKKIICKGARAADRISEIQLVHRWTSRIVADLIRKKWGISYSHFHVRRVLHSLRLSCQKPDIVAAEHSPEAVVYWRHYVWPTPKIKYGKKKRTKTATS